VKERRSLPPRPVAPEVWVWPATPDGCALVTIEVRGETLATEVVGPGMTAEQCTEALRRLAREAWRRC
jgi:hypothetical protein